MIVLILNRDEDLSQAVLPLAVFCLHVEIILRLHLRVQRRPRLSVDDPRAGVDEEPVEHMVEIT